MATTPDASPMDSHASPTTAGKSGMAPAEGALPQIRAATDPAAHSGQFYVPLWVQSGPPVHKPILRRLGAGRAIKRLWEVSERETGLKIDVSATD